MDPGTVRIRDPRTELATTRLLEWLRRDEQADVLRRLVWTLGRTGYPAEIDVTDEVLVRMTLLEYVAPVAVEQGPKAELACMLLEFGFYVVDWREITRAILEGREKEGE